MFIRVAEFSAKQIIYWIPDPLGLKQQCFIDFRIPNYILADT